MNQQAASSDSTTSFRTTPKSEPPSRVPLCRHRTKNGKPCRYSAAGYSGLCPHHASRSAYRYADPQIAADLLGDLTEFQSAAEVNQFLSRMLLLLAQDRLSPRRGAVMAYTCNLLLRSLRAMDLESAANGEADPEIIFDLVRPKRDDDEPPTDRPTH